jgi:hypothetical protein
MQTTIQQFIDYIGSSQHDLSIGIKINRQKCSLWVFDFTTMTGTYFSDLQSLDHKLEAKRQANLEATVKELQQNGYDVTRP